MGFPQTDYYILAPVVSVLAPAVEAVLVAVVVIFVEVAVLPLAVVEPVECSLAVVPAVALFDKQAVEVASVVAVQSDIAAPLVEAVELPAVAVVGF